MRAWLVVHVLAAIGGMGPELAFGLMGPRARRAGRVEAVAVYRAIAAARARVVYPCLAAQVVSGVALVVLGRWSVGREGWLAASLVLYGLAVAVVAAVLVPGSARARRALEEGLEPADPRLRPLWRRQAAAGGAAGAMLVAVAVLMVWKPGRS